MATGLDKIGVLSWEMTLDNSRFKRSMKSSVMSLKKIDKNATKTNAKMSKGFNKSALSAGILGFSLVSVAKSSLQVATAYDKINNGLKTVFGSAEAANKEFEFLKNISEDLGLSLKSAATGFVQVSAAAKGTSLEGEGVKNLFLGVSEASTALGLSADESKGALRAISQVMSKGKVQAEELRGQLGERIPGAFQIAARAMNMTTSELDKMLVRGELLSEDFLPKFGAQLRKEFGGAAKNASDSIAANTNRMHNAWEKALTGMGKATASVIPSITSALKHLNMSLEEAGAQFRQFMELDEFGADASFNFAGNAVEIAASMGDKQKERLGLLGKSTKEIAAMFHMEKGRLILRKELLSIARSEQDILDEENAKAKAEAHRKKGLTGFGALDKELAQGLRMQTIKEQAGLTANEFERMQPAIKKALDENVKLVDIIEKAKNMSSKFKNELNEGAKADLSIFADIDNMQKSLEKAADKARKKRINDLKEHARQQDPRAFAGRAMAGSVEEFKILAGQDTTAKKSLKHLSRIDKEIERLEAI